MFDFLSKSIQSGLERWVVNDQIVPNLEERSPGVEEGIQLVTKLKSRRESDQSVQKCKEVAQQVFATDLTKYALQRSTRS